MFTPAEVAAFVAAVGTALIAVGWRLGYSTMHHRCRHALTSYRRNLGRIERWRFNCQQCGHNFTQAAVDANCVCPLCHKSDCLKLITPK